MCVLRYYSGAGHMTARRPLAFALEASSESDWAQEEEVDW